jgi:serine O-acetyltransferase
MRVLIRSDINRLRRYGSKESTLRLLLTNQGLWACLCYRVGHELQKKRFPPVVRHLVMGVFHLWWKWVEMATGISISPDCTIGPGLYIGHFGQIILHPDVVMGMDCNLSQGVTLGLAEKDGTWGVPTVGDRVYIAPGAKIVGPIHLASGTVVGANAVVIADTETDATVVGIPARMVNRNGSGDFIQPEDGQATDS